MSVTHTLIRSTKEAGYRRFTLHCVVNILLNFIQHCELKINRVNEELGLSEFASFTIFDKYAIPNMIFLVTFNRKQSNDFYVLSLLLSWIFFDTI